jgi:hypothetical protein
VVSDADVVSDGSEDGEIATFDYWQGKRGFDQGVGHFLLLLYDAKTPHSQKSKEFKGLGHDPSNTSISLL